MTICDDIRYAPSPWGHAPLGPADGPRAHGGSSDPHGASGSHLPGPGGTAPGPTTVRWYSLCAPPNPISIQFINNIYNRYSIRNTKYLISYMFWIAFLYVGYPQTMLAGLPQFYVLLKAMHLTQKTPNLWQKMYSDCSLVSLVSFTKQLNRHGQEHHFEKWSKFGLGSRPDPIGDQNDVHS